jgi:hypothetical protein
MTTSLATFIGYARQDLRDETATPAFSDDELTDLIIAGIAELGQFYPKEVVADVDVADFTAYRIDLPDTIKQIFRVERYDADGNFVETIPESPNDQTAGWQVHADGLYIPPGTYPDGSTLKLWGYGPWSNFGWPSDAEGNWWASGSPGETEYSDTGIILASVKEGDTFIAWSDSAPLVVTGASCDVEQIGASNMYRLTFTGEGVIITIVGASEAPYIVLHKVTAMPFIGE